VSVNARQSLNPLRATPPAHKHLRTRHPQTNKIEVQYAETLAGPLRQCGLMCENMQPVTLQKSTGQWMSSIDPPCAQMHCFRQASSMSYAIERTSMSN
jgi:hypothetical protein